ncbi:MAG TPA: LLM class flavin-dependent oxidoreductase [Acidimicrobiales bacterium]|nr:LLM class flavin-dependent oxidoreductase [Acidimicrobiales bacterium]
MSRPPLSVLDLAVVNKGGTSADALAGTTALARRAEALGYRRFWVAEHHNMPLVASTTPPVLMAHLAASTTTIRIGSGGIMLPNHAPLVVAEHVAALEALHPGRIDLGIGRAPGTNQETALALRRSVRLLGAEDFPNELIDLMGLLGDVRGEGGLWERFSATPVATSSPEILLLGSSGFSAQLAGRLGLPFVFAHHFDQGGTLEALDLYRAAFRPSPVLDAPHVMVTANVLVAPTDEEAEHEAAPGRLMAALIRYGRFEPLVPPEEAAAHLLIATTAPAPTNRIVGSPATAVAELDHLVAATGADEIMVSTVAYGLDTRLRSLELLAAAWTGGSALPAAPGDELVEGNTGR